MDTVRQLKHRLKNIKWKNVKRTASIAKGKAVSKMKDFYMTDFENRIRKATSNRNWSVGSVELAEIAQYSYNPLLYKIMMDIVYSRLKDKGHNWKRVYKALELIRYLLLHGAPGVLLDMQHNIHTIESLENFRYVHPKTGKDVGQNVRYKAKQVVDLIRDHRLLEKEREQSKAMLDKISQSRRVAYSNNSSYLERSKSKVEDIPVKRTSQRVIVTSSNSRIYSASNSQNGYDSSAKVTSQDTEPSNKQQHLSQEDIENDLLLFEDLDEDDEASVSEESSHGVDHDKDFGEFVESFSEVKLEAPSTKGSDDLLTDLGFSDSGPSLQQNIDKGSKERFVSDTKNSAGIRKDVEETKSEDRVVTMKREGDSSNDKSIKSMSVAKSPSKESGPSGTVRKKVVLDSHSKIEPEPGKVASLQKDSEEDPFGQLVSEWISASHSQRR